MVLGPDEHATEPRADGFDGDIRPTRWRRRSSDLVGNGADVPCCLEHLDRVDPLASVAHEFRSTFQKQWTLARSATSGSTLNRGIPDRVPIELIRVRAA